MAFQFPAAPTIGQIFNPSPGIEYKWNGYAWDYISSGAISQAQGDARYVQKAEDRSRRNAVINGDFVIWNEGTSFVSPGNGAYTAELWQVGKVGVGDFNVSKAADAPTAAQAGRFTTDCFLLDVTTVDATIDPADLYQVIHYIEGYNFAPLAQNSMTLSFWHKHTKTGVYCAGLRNSSSDRSYVIEYTQAVTDVWEKTTVVISASPAAGTWNYTNGIGIYISFVVAAGTNTHTTPNAWQTSNFTATVNQVNGMDSIANNFRIDLIQLEPGTVATPFEYSTVQETLEATQRYWEKSYDQNVIPGTNSVPGSAGITVNVGPSTVLQTNVAFRVRKRAIPTVVSYAEDGAINSCSTSAGNQVNAQAKMGETGFLNGVSGAGMISLAFQWTANARL